MIRQIAKQQFEDILYNPNISVQEKRSNFGKRSHITCLISNGKYLATRVITPNSTRYYIQ